MLLPYLLLTATSLCLCGMTFLRKKYQLSNGTSIIPSLIFTGIYDLLVVLIGVIFTFFQGEFTLISSINKSVLLIALTLSFTISITTIICVIGSLYGNVAILVLFANLGQLLLSALYGVAFDAERNKLSIWIVIGIILSIVIVILNFFDQGKSEKSEEKTKNYVVFRVFCLVVFVTNGVALILYSLMTKYNPEYGYVDFIVLYSFFGLILTAIISIITILVKNKKTEENKQKLKISKKSFIYIVIYAVLFISSEAASLYTTKLIPIVVQAPLSFALQLLIISSFDWIIFKSKPSMINLVQMILAIVCSVMFVL